jgi:hypothetical protein
MSPSVDALVTDLESRGLGWDLGHAGRLREVRVWHWPFVVGRHRPAATLPLGEMLAKAMHEVDFEYYTVLKPGETIKPYRHYESR